MDVRSLLVPVALVAGCGPSTLEFAGSDTFSIFDGSTDKLTAENDRAFQASIGDGDGSATASLSACSKVVNPEIIPPGGGNARTQQPNGVASNDGALFATELILGAALQPTWEFLDVDDGKVAFSLDLPSETPIAIAEGGAVVATQFSATNGAPPFHVHLVTVATKKSVDAGELPNNASVAAAQFAGADLYVVAGVVGADGVFLRITPDGKATNVTPPSSPVLEIHGEPKGKRLYGICGGTGATQAFVVEDGNAKALPGYDKALKLGVAPGGRLATLLPTTDPPTLFVSGSDGASPQALNGGGLTFLPSGVSALAPSDDGSAVLMAAGATVSFMPYGDKKIASVGGGNPIITLLVRRH